MKDKMLNEAELLSIQRLRLKKVPYEDIADRIGISIERVKAICKKKKTPKENKTLPTYNSPVLKDFIDKANKPFTYAVIRDIFKEFNDQEDPISFGRMVEKFNEVAFEFFKKNSNEDIRKILYQNSIDDSECIRIKFENIDNVINLINKKNEI